MTASVKLFTYAGVVSVPVANQQLASSDQSLVLVKQPYLGSGALSCETASPATSQTSAAPRGATLALIEVQDGKRVHHEVTPANSDLRTATSNSPTLSGHRTIQFGEGWRLSVLEAV